MIALWKAKRGYLKRVKFKRDWSNRVYGLLGRNPRRTNIRNAVEARLHLNWLRAILGLIAAIVRGRGLLRQKRARLHWNRYNQCEQRNHQAQKHLPHSCTACRCQDLEPSAHPLEPGLHTSPFGAGTAA
jgi:hypothetical protein